jgi:alkanesulfonate monooxygenase SsuD/methylene tetrahydromethanopterin reductase-like flavin-dependent oxidoreductase (luciferase family)
MELDIFFSISQTEAGGYFPSEQEMFRNFFEQVELADDLGFGTAWVAESHLSTEVQKTNPGAVIPHFKGEIGLNTDILQLAHRIFARTKRIGVGSAIMNILANGGPIAAAERIKTFLAMKTSGAFSPSGLLRGAFRSSTSRTESSRAMPSKQRRGRW